MKKMNQVFCCLLFIYMCTAHAKTSTSIFTAGNPARCNHWGWESNYGHVIWPNACAPLEVRVKDKILQVDSTDVCKGEGNFVASYYVDNDKLVFIKCHHHKS